ncbi:MAG TPA: phosphatase domain-containing protein, partial [Pyrinomonadaceae bacterium]|nr:phosphatase domain-containing protein [Pyrinomonadaceae bacterium]
MASDFLKKTAGDFISSMTEKAGDLLDEFKRDKEVVPFPTYGYRQKDDANTWVIPLRVWVSKARRLPVRDEILGVFASDMGDLSADDIARLRARLKHFVADDDSGEAVSVKFDDDPEGQTHDLPGVTDFNGLVSHELRLTDARARRILDAQGSTSGWLTFTATAEGFEGKGRARLVEPRGLSVVSDIDDTIKITEVPAGKRIVLRNAFLRGYAVVPGMVEKYQGHGGDVMFHYVSGSPWQLYKILGDFLVGESGFPEGAFHMKDVRKNLLER